MRRQLDNAFAAQGLKPGVHLESDTLEDLVHAARENNMVALLNGAAAMSLDVQDAVPLAEIWAGKPAWCARAAVTTALPPST